jgi:NADPH:quinone reductase-like Zn-dependent oxidoreductase
VIVSSSAAKLDRARALGADHCIDRPRDDWVEAVYAITNDRGCDYVLETVGGSQVGKSVQVAAVGGHLYQVGALEGFDPSTPAMPLMMKDVTIHGIGTGHRRALQDLVRAVDRTGIVPVVDARYRLADLPAALDHLDRGPFGKIVVKMTD